jgi:hypothetical protein
MRDLMRRTVRTAVKAGLVDLALQAVDGTRIAGNSSRHRIYDGKGLRRLLDRVEATIKDLEAQNSTGGEPTPPSLPKELASAEALRERVAEALGRVEAEEGPNHENLTDQQAGLLSTRAGGFIAGYNAQAVAATLRSPPLSPDDTPEGSGMIITAVGLTANSDDQPHLIPMIEASADNTENRHETVTLADAGYHSGANLADCEASGYRVLMPESHDRKRRFPYHKDKFAYRPETDTYLCPQGQELTHKDSFRHQHGYFLRRYRAQGQVCRADPAFGECTKDKHGRSLSVSEHEPLLQRHRKLMAADSAKDLYRRRQALIEPVFGLLKECHSARRFLLRGRHNVLSEWYLLATAFNLKSLHRVWAWSLQPTPPSTSVTRRGRLRLFQPAPDEQFASASALPGHQTSSSHSTTLSLSRHHTSSVTFGDPSEPFHELMGQPPGGKLIRLPSKSKVGVLHLTGLIHTGVRLQDDLSGPKHCVL